MTVYLVGALGIALALFLIVAATRAIVVEWRGGDGTELAPAAPSLDGDLDDMRWDFPRTRLPR